MTLSPVDIRINNTEILRCKIMWFLDDCNRLCPELYSEAEELFSDAQKHLTIGYSEMALKEACKKFNRLKTIFSLSNMKKKYERKGEFENAEKIQKRIDAWREVSKVKKQMPIGLQILLVILGGIAGGLVMFLCLDFILALIFIIPAIIAFFGQALIMGAKME